MVVEGEGEGEGEGGGEIGVGIGIGIKAGSSTMHNARCSGESSTRRVSSVECRDGRSRSRTGRNRNRNRDSRNTNTNGKRNGVEGLGGKA